MNTISQTNPNREDLHKMNPRGIFGKIFTHPLFLMSLLFLSNALLWAYITPYGSAPDELAHIDYVLHVFQDHKLPIFGVTPATTNPNAFNLQAMQPPLYYILAALSQVFVPHESMVLQVLAMRAVSVAIGLLTVWVVYALVRNLVPQKPYLAVTAAALVAFDPMFTYVSSYVTNDGLATLACAATLFCWERLLVKVTRQYLISLGAILGIGILAKFSILPLIALTGILLFWLAFCSGKNVICKIILYGLWVGIPLIVISGWLLVRNWMLYGDPTTLTIFSNYPQVYPSHPYSEQGSLIQMLTARSLPLGGFWESLLHGFWGIFDFYSIWLSPYIYFTLDIVLIVGILGVVLWLSKHIRFWKDKEQQRYLIFACMCGITIVSIVWANISRSYQIDYQPQGRYLFPALVPLFLIIVLGCNYIAHIDSLRRLVSGILILIMIVANMSALMMAVAPAYHNVYVRNLEQEKQKEARMIYGAFPYHVDFVAHQEKIDHFELFLTVQKFTQTPIVWVISDKITGVEVGTALVYDLTPGIVRHIVDTHGISFTAGRTYTLELRTPWVTNDKAVSALPSLASAQSDEGVHIIYPFDMQAWFLNGDYTFRTDAPDSIRGLGQRLLYITTILLILSFLVRILSYTLHRWEKLAFLISISLVLFILWRPVFSTTPKFKIADQLSRIEPGSVFFRPNVDNPASVNLQLLMESAYAKKDPTDDLEQYISSIQPYEFMIGEDRRNVIQMQPPSSLTYTVNIPDGAQFHTSLALNPDVWQPDKGDGVLFEVFVKDTRGSHILLQKYIDPKHNPVDRRWNDVSLDLSDYANQRVELMLRVSPGPIGDTQYDWSGWAYPIIEPDN